MKKERAISVSLTNGAECICDPDIVLGDKYGLWDINNEVSPRGTLLDLNVAWELFISKQGFSNYTFEQQEDSEHERITYILVDKDKNPVGPEFTVETDNGEILVPITETITSLTAEKGKYYRLDVPVETLAITLPAMDAATSVKKVGIYFTAGTTPDVTITAADNKSVVFQNGYEIEAGKTYKVNALFDGSAWIVSALTIILPPPPMNIITYEASAKLVETIDSIETGLHTNAFSGTSGQLTITKHTFENGVGTIEFDDDVTSIGDYAFESCGGLTSVTIPDSVTSIGSEAFNGCKGLTSITIPDSVTSIGSEAFNGCYVLTSITIPNSVTSIGEGAFYECHSLTSVTIPDSVTSIGDMAFRECHSLTSVIIGSGVTSIGNEAFNGCSLLTSVTIGSGVTTIGYMAFYDCQYLTSINIPDSVTSIGEQAFLGSGLISVTIGSGVTSIGNSAFSNCTDLTSVTIPDSVTSIGESAFSYSGLTSVTVEATTPPTLGSGAFETDAEERKIYVPSASVNAYKAAENWSDYAEDIEAIPSV